jgi:hypothetical protein
MPDPGARHPASVAPDVLERLRELAQGRSSRSLGVTAVQAAEQRREDGGGATLAQANALRGMIGPGVATGRVLAAA